MDCAKVLSRTLRENGFEIARETKHRVWKQRGTGRIFVTSLTPSDVHWAKCALDNLRRVLAAPPRSEILTISEFEDSERKIQLVKQEKQRAGGAAPSKSEGTGFTYIDRKPSRPMTPEQKAKSREAAEWSKQRAKAAATERVLQKQLTDFISEWLVQVWKEVAQESHEPAIAMGADPDPDNLAATDERFVKAVLDTAKPAISFLSRTCVRYQAVDLTSFKIGFADSDTLLAAREKADDLMASVGILPRDLRQDLLADIMEACEDYIVQKKAVLDEAVEQCQEGNRISQPEREAVTA
jgi:hypothetical protein